MENTKIMLRNQLFEKVVDNPFDTETFVNPFRRQLVRWLSLPSYHWSVTFAGTKLNLQRQAKGGDSLRRFLAARHLILHTGDGSRTRTGSGQRAKWLDQFYFKFIKSASAPWTRVISSDFQTMHTD
ncbi:hypothetical protein ANTPLA_LOCUS3855 [Anthophora plagiata]